MAKNKGITKIIPAASSMNFWGQKRLMYLCGFLFSSHFSFYLFNFDNRLIEFDYFGKSEPYLEIVKGTYADKKAAIEHKEYFWCHSLEEMISPLLEEGLTML